MSTIIAPSEGRGFHLAEGQHIRITTPKGHQAADFLPTTPGIPMNGSHRITPGYGHARFVRVWAMSSSADSAARCSSL